MSDGKEGIGRKRRWLDDDDEFLKRHYDLQRKKYHLVMLFGRLHPLSHTHMVMMMMMMAMAMIYNVDGN